MEQLNEGEIIIVERYGGSQRERVYIHPPDQLNVIVVEENRRSRIRRLLIWFVMLFLPQGYPESVTKDYAAYQLYYAAQFFFGSVAGVLATQEILRSVGVGDSAASPLAATITWIYRDGFEQIGKIMFSTYQGCALDAYSKRWNLYSNLVIDFATSLEMSLSLMGSWGIFVLCISTMLKAVEGVSMATRVALTAHHAIRGNLADVAAKDASQETVIKLLGAFTAVFIMKYIGFNGVAFVIAMVCHVLFNYMAVRSVCLSSLNEPRYVIAVHSYLTRGFIPRTCDVNLKEPILRGGTTCTPEFMTSFKIKIGCSIEEVVKTNPRAFDLRMYDRVYQDQLYILYPDMKRRVMYVLLKPGGYPNTVICAYFHALLLSILICAINKEKLLIFSTGSQNFTALYRTMMESKWPRAPVRQRTPNGLKYEPSERLLAYVLKTVEIEWCKIYSGLLQSGWMVHRHLFLMGQWLVGYDPEEDSDSDTASMDGPIVFETFEEALQEAIAYRNEELEIEERDNDRPKRPHGQLHVVKPTIEPEPRLSSESEVRRRSCVDDDKITHISTHVAPRAPDTKKSRPKKD